MSRLGGTLVLCLAGIALVGACHKKKQPAAKPDPVAKPDPAVAKEVRAHVQHIFGGALVPVPDKGQGQGPLVFRYGGGRIEVLASRQGSGLRIRVKVAGVKLQTLAMSGPWRGTIEGDGDLTTGGPKGLQGHVTLRCVKCGFGGTKAHLAPGSKAAADPLASAGITLPSLGLGRMQCRIELSGQQASFHGCGARSADVRADLTGQVELRDPLAQSTAQAKLRIRFTDALMTREPKWRALQSALSRGTPGGGIVFTIKSRLAAPRIGLSKGR